MTQVNISLNNYRLAPRKARLILDLMRNKLADDVLDQLNNLNKLATNDLSKLVKSGIAIIKDKNPASNNIYITKASANESISYKRRWLRAKGQATTIKKSLCHIKLTLSDESKNDRSEDGK